MSWDPILHKEAFDTGFNAGRGRWISVSEFLPMSSDVDYLCATKAYGDNGYFYRVYGFTKNGKEFHEDLSMCDGPTFYRYDSEYGYIEQEPDFWMPIIPVEEK